MRVNRSEVEQAFVAYVEAIGGRVGKSYDDVGGYRLMYQPGQGYVVEQVVNDRGGVTRPLGSLSRRAEEMFNTFGFAARSVELSGS